MFVSIAKIKKIRAITIEIKIKKYVCEKKEVNPIKDSIPKAMTSVSLSETTTITDFLILMPLNFFNKYDFRISPTLAGVMDMESPEKKIRNDIFNGSLILSFLKKYSHFKNLKKSSIKAKNKIIGITHKFMV